MVDLGTSIIFTSFDAETRQLVIDGSLTNEALVANYTISWSLIDENDAVKQYEQTIELFNYEEPIIDV